MAAITQSSTLGAGKLTITPTTLSASDTLTFNQGVNQTLVLHNGTAGSLTPTITGSTAPSAYNAPGGPIGANLSTGYAVGAIAAGASRLIKLDTIANYLHGTITITGGTGITAFLLADA